MPPAGQAHRAVGQPGDLGGDQAAPVETAGEEPGAGRAEVDGCVEVGRSHLAPGPGR